MELEWDALPVPQCQKYFIYLKDEFTFNNGLGLNLLKLYSIPSYDDRNLQDS
ncbi:hypothetical protein [Cytobacillus praedii]|uniref:hypothetical protein n=1 Tax=Cytobacillus praedii TaxID=1742358 RepID=UPI002E1D113E|nr:hypothetical protein [Cytobacillus praedii]